MFLPKLNEIRCPDCRMPMTKTGEDRFTCVMVKCSFKVWKKTRWGLELVSK